MSQRALLLIDLQNDFCPGGALAVADGDATLSVANRLIALSQSRGDKVLASQDWHPADHGSFAGVQQRVAFEQGLLDGLVQTWWPVHCVQHSQGAEFHADLNHRAIDFVVRKGSNPVIDSYSAFFDNGHRQDTGLHRWLQENKITQLVILGLATDYCVKFTVLDALALGYDVTVITDGCRGVNILAVDSDQAFAAMADAGARLMVSDAYCAS